MLNKLVKSLFTIYSNTRLEITTHYVKGYSGKDLIFKAPFDTNVTKTLYMKSFNNKKLNIIKFSDESYTLGDKYFSFDFPYDDFLINDSGDESSLLVHSYSIDDNIIKLLNCSANSKDTRYFLKSVAFSPTDNKLIATDGFVFAVFDQKNSTNPYCINNNKKLIDVDKFIIEADILSMIDVCLNKNGNSINLNIYKSRNTIGYRANLVCNGVIFSNVLIDYIYPNVSSFLKLFNTDHGLKVNNKDLIDELKKIKSFRNKESKVTLKSDNSGLFLTYSLFDNDFIKYFESLSSDTKLIKSLSFQPNLLLKVLKFMNNEVSLKTATLEKGDDILIIQDGQFDVIVMPLRN